MSKSEKKDAIYHNFVKGAGISFFGITWTYFNSVMDNVWASLPPTIMVVGVLISILAIIKKISY